MGYIRSPIYYMGNKYCLLPYIIPQFPEKEEVDTFIDLFGGSGCVSLNVEYDNIIYNELNVNIYNLLKMYKCSSPDDIINHIEKRLVEFNLIKVGVDDRTCKDQELIKKCKKNYLKFRDFYNSQKQKNVYDLYLLTCYSFSNLLRFNSNEEFNMPFGNRSYIDENANKIRMTNKRLNSKEITLENKNAFDILANITENKNQFIYLDPPYSNTLAIYNEKTNGGWTIEDDNRLFAELDRLNKLGIKWAMSNVLENKGNSNEHIEQWARKNNYTIIEIENKEYASLGKGNSNSREVLIINYKQRVKKYSIFDFMEED